MSAALVAACCLARALACVHRWPWAAKFLRRVPALVCGQPPSQQSRWDNAELLVPRCQAAEMVQLRMWVEAPRRQDCHLMLPPGGRPPLCPPLHVGCNEAPAAMRSAHVGPSLIHQQPNHLAQLATALRLPTLHQLLTGLHGRSAQPVSLAGAHASQSPAPNRGSAGGAGAGRGRVGERASAPAAGHAAGREAGLEVRGAGRVETRRTVCPCPRCRPTGCLTSH